MTGRNRSDCKYVESCTHHVGSIGVPEQKDSVFRGTNTKLWEVPNTVNRNKKTNICQEGSTGLKATVVLNKNKVRENDVSFYVNNVGLISLRQKYNCKKHEGRKR
jgi:hypothetical protein